jgi:hypothetical protein
MWRRPLRPTASYSRPFEAYFEPFEQGGGSSGQAYLMLPAEERRAVREEVRHHWGDTGGPVEIDVVERLASGRH